MEASTKSEELSGSTAPSSSSSTAVSAAPLAFTFTVDDVIAGLETALGPGATGSDSDGNRTGSISSLNGPLHMSAPHWYDTASDYWDGIDPTVDGMLGGFAALSPSDLRSSSNFLKEVKESRPSLVIGGGRACECGAGIGRVSKGLLLPMGVERCDLLEASADLISMAPEYIGDPGAGRCRYYCEGMQGFDPGVGVYDVIWVQWCIGYLADLDAVKFFRRMAASLTPGGVLVLKDNTCGGMERNLGDVYILDRVDSSVTRSAQYLVALAEMAGLSVVRRRNQGDVEGEESFPEDIFPVPMIALECRPVHDGGN